MSLNLTCFISSFNVHEYIHKQIFFCLSLTYLLNKPTTNAQTWLVYKKTKKKTSFYRAKSKLFINSLTHLQP